MTNTLEAKAVQLVMAFEQRLADDKSQLLTNTGGGNGDGANTPFEMVRYIAHRIAGSARIFGCEDLSIPAKELETLVENNADTTLIIQAVNELVDQIEKTLADGIPPPEWMNSPTA